MSHPIQALDLIELGFPQNHILGIALRINKKRTGYNRSQMIQKYSEVLQSPESFLDDPLFSPLALAMIGKEDASVIALSDEHKHYERFGADFIEAGALSQMDIALRLPVTVKAALMPDAHQGYGLPIGGVMATDGAIIPYGVGVDIGCRMAISVFELPEKDFDNHQSHYKNLLMDHTLFGAGQGFDGVNKSEHEILDRSEFNLTPMIKNLKDKAWAQLGTSGGGNHFVEWGILDFAQDDEIMGIRSGRYLALLSHSGSRGMGASIAHHYTKLAKEQCRLPREAENLAYFTLDSELGQEYWMAMNLAGDYASACHEIIHQKIIKALGAMLIVGVENHHNFAWKEMIDDRELVVHRKGATPAGNGVMGIIPGSMTAPGFLVRGKGNPSSLYSASHGAGRQMSRTKAESSYSHADLREVVAKNKVELIGGGIDEIPMAYKDIHQVMEAQRDLVDIVAQFQPKIVRMADDGSRED
ncbi:MAG TPA: RtcB family protein [Saprospiraceae bacterium]|nr:RtcB family protein [Saprospiraceae bacterium]